VDIFEISTFSSTHPPAPRACMIAD
jgi:hypothetical protein